MSLSIKDLKTLLSGNVHTVIGSFRSEKLKSTSQTKIKLRLLDDQITTLIVHEPSPTKQILPAKTIVLFHGLGGSCYSNYITRFTNFYLNLGYRVVSFNHLGALDEDKVHAASLYHAGRYQDFLTTFDFVKNTWPNSKIVTAAFSLSANMLLLLLSTPEFLQWNREGYLERCFIVCPPVNLGNCALKLKAPRNKHYDLFFVKNLVLQVEKWKSLNPQNQNFSWKGNIRSVKDFDQLITTQFCNLPTANEYYTAFSSIDRLKHIQTPTQIFAALDDPIVESKDLLTSQLSASTQLVMKETGGHLGFLTHPLASLGQSFWQTLEPILSNRRSKKSTMESISAEFLHL